mgnify:CR=1 FL=1
MAKKKSNMKKKGGNPSKKELYAKASKHSTRAIEILVDLMEHGDNDNVRLGAARVILSKSIPDLRAMEITGTEGEPIIVKIIGDYASQRGGNVSPSERSVKD